MNQVVVNLSIPRDEWLKIYRGEARAVFAKSIDGRSVQFPANILNDFVTHAGVSGIFVIDFDTEGKCTQVKKVA